MATKGFRFRRKSSPEREKQVKRLRKVKKTILVQGEEVTIKVAICPPPMECADLLPPRGKRERKPLKIRTKQ